MKRHPSILLHGASLAASTALTAVALFTVLPVVRAQSPSPAEEHERDASSDVFDVIKKGADKLQKQAKEAGKIGPQIKAMEERQAEFIKHQTEMEHRLEAVLIKQTEEIQALKETVERLETGLKAYAMRPGHPLPAPPMVPPPPAPAGPAAPLPATEPPGPKSSPSPTPPRAFAAPTVM